MKNQMHGIISRATLVFLLPVCLMPAYALFPLEGTVGETLDADRYTYIRVDNADGSSWVATSPLNVPVGAAVTVPDGIVMKDFESAALKRTFEQVIFAETVEAAGMMRNSAEPAGLPAGHPPIGNSSSHDAECPVKSDQTVPADGISGEIIETMDAGNYTYIRVKGAGKTIWAATGKFNANVGDHVLVPEGMVMKNFTSPTLDKTFHEIYFVDQVYPADKAKGKDACCEQKHEHDESEHAEEQSYAEETITFAEPLTPPADGLSIAEIYRRRQELAGQDVLVRGKVVKYSPNIMDKNWIHVQDGTGEGETADLTVTSADSFDVGDVVVLKGKVEVDVLIGSHYRWPVIVQDAIEVTE